MHVTTKVKWWRVVSYNIHDGRIDVHIGLTVKQLSWLKVFVVCMRSASDILCFLKSCSVWRMEEFAQWMS